MQNSWHRPVHKDQPWLNPSWWIMQIPGKCELKSKPSFSCSRDVDSPKEQSAIPRLSKAPWVNVHPSYAAHLSSCWITPESDHERAKKCCRYKIMKCFWDKIKKGCSETDLRFSFVICMFRFSLMRFIPQYPSAVQANYYTLPQGRRLQMLMGIKWEYQHHIFSTCGNSCDLCVYLFSPAGFIPSHGVEEKMDER